MKFVRDRRCLLLFKLLLLMLLMLLFILMLLLLLLDVELLLEVPKDVIGANTVLPAIVENLL